MSSALEIRQIREADIETFYELLTVVIGERKYLAFLQPPPLSGTRAFVMGNIARGNPHLVAVTGEGRIAGWCDVVPMARDAMAHVGSLGIALAPEWRGRGLGERLMQRAIAIAWTSGLAKIELGVRAQALYRKLGFVEEGRLSRRVRIDGIFHDEIVMAIVGP